MEHLPAPVTHTVNSVSAGIMAVIAPIVGATAAVGCTTAVIIAGVIMLIIACLVCATSPCWLLYILAQTP